MSSMNSNENRCHYGRHTVPTTLAIESEAFMPGWRSRQESDRQAITREVEGANWNLSIFLPGELRPPSWVATGQEPCEGQCEVLFGENKRGRSLILWHYENRFETVPRIPCLSVTAFQTYPAKVWPSHCKGCCLENASCLNREVAQRI